MWILSVNQQIIPEIKNSVLRSHLLVPRAQSPRARWRLLGRGGEALLAADGCAERCLP